MVAHIYGKLNLNLDPDRPHVFVKEAQLYVSHLKNEFQKLISNPTTKQENYLEKFRGNLEEGIEYYQELLKSVQLDSEEILEKMKSQLNSLRQELYLLKPDLI
jgi:hypothetical protein